jgi:K+-transporting ATPase KdpF subunit
VHSFEESEWDYARRNFPDRDHRLLFGFHRLCAFLQSPEVRMNVMNSESLIMLIVSAGVLVYLTYAMLRPEKF